MTEGTIYNVAVPVVALVRAASPQDAVAKVVRSLMKQGFDPFEPETRADVFESEILDLEPEPLP